METGACMEVIGRPRDMCHISCCLHTNMAVQGRRALRFPQERGLDGNDPKPQNVVPGPAVLASPRKLLEMQILGPHSR